MNQDSLYTGGIEHRRFSPRENSFTYGVCYYFLDLEKVREVFDGTLFCTFNRPGLLSFWEKDYLKVREVRETIFTATGKESRGPVRILTNISYFGFCFNPVSFYYCYGMDGEDLEFIVSVITNTPWGEKHRQVFEYQEPPKQAFEFKKDFHVSPFMPMQIDYTWVFEKPGQRLYILMQNRTPSESKVIFDSTLTLRREPLTKSAMASAFLRFPLLTFKTVAAIYYQALKLYIKRVPVHTHPLKENL